MQVLEAVEGAGKDCLSSTGGGTAIRNTNNIPGWNDYVNTFCQESSGIQYGSRQACLNKDLFLMQ